MINEIENKRECRICGCTDNNACSGGCYWVEDDLCSNCTEISHTLDFITDFANAKETRKFLFVAFLLRFNLITYKYAHKCAYKLAGKIYDRLDTENATMKKQEEVQND
jgi:hypothetical protein